jgi:hypothetical protein
VAVSSPCTGGKWKALLIERAPILNGSAKASLSDTSLLLLQHFKVDRISGRPCFFLWGNPADFYSL